MTNQRLRFIRSNSFYVFVTLFLMHTLVALAHDGEHLPDEQKSATRVLGEITFPTTTKSGEAQDADGGSAALHMQLVDEVDKVLTPDASHWLDMMNGCDELSDHLAIAKLAAKSRFH